MAKPLDGIQRMLRGEIPQAAVARLIGFTLTAVEPGEATSEFEAGPRHANPMGTLHGGVLCDVESGTRSSGRWARSEEGPNRRDG